MLGDIVESLMNIEFTVLGFTVDLSNLGATAEQLCDWQVIQNSTLGDLLNVLNGGFVAVGLNLLTVFVMIDLIKKAMEIDRISWERIVMSVARFLIFKMLITYSYRFLNMIMEIGSDFIEILKDLISFNGDASYNIGQALGDLINNAEGGITIPIINWSIMPLVLFIVFIIIYLPMMGTFVQAASMIFVRVIKIIIAFAFAPIPLAIGTWEDGSATGKRFIMSVVALAFEGLLTILCVHIYSMGIRGLGSNTTTFGGGIGAMIGILLLNGILATVLQASQQLAEKWTGA